jgi:putative transposase
MSTFESLSHSRWDCKYHVVFVPKCRKKALYGKIRKFLGPVFHELASQRRSQIFRGAHSARSRAYVNTDSSKVPRC